MAKLRNRIRRFVVDGRPAALGVVAVGDAPTCTNPLYGRGCSLGIVHAELLADAVAAHDAVRRALRTSRCEDGDRARRDRALVQGVGHPGPGPARRGAPAAAGVAGRGAGAGRVGPEEVQRDFMRSVLREGLFPPCAPTPVFRAFLRGFNLLSHRSAHAGPRA